MESVEGLAEEGEGEGQVGGGQLGGVPPIVKHRGVGYIANGQVCLSVWDDLRENLLLNWFNFGSVNPLI